MERIYLTKWLTEYRCVFCKKAMSEYAMMYSSGRCPNCGEKHKDACTIVKCTEHAYRVYVEQPAPPEWMFWRKQPERKREYKDES